MEIKYRELLENGFEEQDSITSHSSIFPENMIKEKDGIVIKVKNIGDNFYQVESARDIYGFMHSTDDIHGPGIFQKARNLDELIVQLENPSYSYSEMRRIKLGRPLQSDYNPELISQGNDILADLILGKDHIRYEKPQDEAEDFYADVYGKAT